MPPKKLPESPVIFTFRLPETDTTPEPAGSTEYADILKSVEQSTPNTRFNADMLKEVLTRSRAPTYNNQTACFWCCHPFNWKAFVCPISYDAYENMYTCEGHYCSPECALASVYDDITLSDTTRWSRHTLLADMYRSLYQGDQDLRPAPSRYLLRMFGGQLDIEQYREYLACGNELVATALPPLRLHVPTMNVQGPVRDVKKFVALSADTVEKASKELRLRRSKPVHTTNPTLDKCMTPFGASLLSSSS